MHNSLFQRTTRSFLSTISTTHLKQSIPLNNLERAVGFKAAATRGPLYLFKFNTVLENAYLKTHFTGMSRQHRFYHHSVSLLHNPGQSGKNPNAIGAAGDHSDHDHDDHSDDEEDHIEVHVHVPHQNKLFKFEAHVGETLMDLVLKEGEVLSEHFECACGGIAACSTCHVYLDKQSYDTLGKPEEFELDMLDLSFEPTETSRLGCQIQFVKSIDGVKITVPKGVKNLHS